MDVCLLFSVLCCPV